MGLKNNKIVYGLLAVAAVIAFMFVYNNYHKPNGVVDECRRGGNKCIDLKCIFNCK